MVAVAQMSDVAVGFLSIFLILILLFGSNT